MIPVDRFHPSGHVPCLAALAQEGLCWPSPGLLIFISGGAQWSPGCTSSEMSLARSSLVVRRRRLLCRFQEARRRQSYKLEISAAGVCGPGSGSDSLQWACLSLGLAERQFAAME